ncbi:MAG: molybdenum cofactor guanylyltransferase MobA [Gammaproteobacteria bacterium]|nr:molybdenum cofactor guanylyltransferase MobA [Gammaproteobacteria bacterium]
MIDAQDITALILAGGKSRRMGGRDKGLLPFGDGLLIGHIIDAIRPQVGAVLISANRNHDAYGEFGVPVLADPLDDFQGPLAGFLAGLEAVETDYLLTLPCDGPVVVDDLARRLASALDAAGADIAVAHDGQRLQPVYALLHRRTLDSLRTALDDGERKIDRWYPRQSWVTVDFSDVPQQFDNINTPDDYARSQPAHPRR